MYPRLLASLGCNLHTPLPCSETSGTAGIGFWDWEQVLCVLMWAVTRYCYLMKFSILYHSLFPKGLRGLVQGMTFNTVTVLLVLFRLCRQGPLCGLESWGWSGYRELLPLTYEERRLQEWESLTPGLLWGYRRQWEVTVSSQGAWRLGF